MSGYYELLIMGVGTILILLGGWIVLKGMTKIIREQGEIQQTDKRKGMQFLQFAVLVAFFATLLDVFETNYSVRSLVRLIIMASVLPSFSVWRLRQDFITHQKEHTSSK